MRVHDKTYLYQESLEDIGRFVDAGLGLLRLVEGQVVIGGITPDELDERLKTLLSVIRETADGALGRSTGAGDNGY